MTQAIDQKPIAFGVDSVPTQPPAPPSAPKFGWWKRWRKAREVKRHERWKAKFFEEMRNAESPVYVTTLTYADQLARGMVMRYMDDRGIRRCAHCISTDQLRKFEGGPARKKYRHVFLCPEHWKAPLGTARDSADASR